MDSGISHGKPSPQSAQWTALEDRPAVAERLAGGLHAPPLLARILANRGFDSVPAAQAFLQPSLRNVGDPFLMHDMEKAVARVKRAIDDHERIAVFGDYDVDGLTATALIVRLFHWLGVEPEWHIPHRVTDGYGMSLGAIERLARAGIQLVVTVDNGISCLEEAALATRLGMDLVITDHHLPGDTLPGAAAVVDPNRADCAYPCPYLAGVGVAFKFAHALLKGLNCPPDESKQFLKKHLDLVAIGSVSDIVPLIDENRILARAGLEVARQTENVGLRAMCDVLGIRLDRLSTYEIGFIIGPRLNAAGRMDHARTALELLLTEDPVQAREIVRYLNQLNEERQRIEKEIFEEAVAMIEQSEARRNASILVAAGEGWHQGVIGIVASRLLSRFGKPSVVLSMNADRGKGSARSVEGFDMVEALEACAECLTGFGGHAMAAGMQLEAKNLERFSETLARYAASRINPELLRPRLTIDVDARLEELSLEGIEALRMLEPCGPANPPPLARLSGVRLVERPRIVGTNHLRLTVGEGGRALGVIGFGQAEHVVWLRDHAGALDLVGVPTINEFNGRRDPQLTLKDIRPAATAE